MRKFLLALVGLLLLLALAMFYPIAPDTESTASSAASRVNPNLASQLQAYVDAHESIDALVVANADELLFETGPTHTPINTHSVRKSIMSVLFGKAVYNEEIDVQATLGELGINDTQMPLSDAELTATVADLLKARSGIYIEAAGETPEMKAGRPQRGQFAPGEHYYYNNWDFNTLGSILARTTHRSLHAHMDELSARLGFLDYQAGHLFFSDASGSEHDQYILYMSARDLARVGQMMLRGGLDKDRQPLMTPAWIEESTAPYSRLEGREPLDSYGYLWSIDEDAGTVWATGWGGQYLLIDAQNNLVIVTRNHTGRRLGAWLWLVALNNSTQGRLGEVATLHDMLVGEGRE